MTFGGSEKKAFQSLFEILGSKMIYPRVTAESQECRKKIRISRSLPGRCFWNKMRLSRGPSPAPRFPMQFLLQGS